MIHEASTTSLTLERCEADHEYTVKIVIGNLVTSLIGRKLDEIPEFAGGGNITQH
jgi:hypothetical protein